MFQGGSEEGFLVKFRAASRLVPGARDKQKNCSSSCCVEQTLLSCIYIYIVFIHFYPCSHALSVFH